MRIEAVHIAQQRKHYYRDVFRLATKLLAYSFLVMVLLMLAIFYKWLTKPQTTFYASNAAGAGFILPLTPRASPNKTKQALLKPAPKPTTSKKALDLPAQ